MSFESSGQNSGQKIGLLIFDCFMSVMYLIFSIILLFTSYLKNWQIPNGVKIGLGVLFGLYGIFRVTRAVRIVMQRNR